MRNNYPWNYPEIRVQRLHGMGVTPPAPLPSDAVGDIANSIGVSKADLVSTAEVGQVAGGVFTLGRLALAGVMLLFSGSGNGKK